MLENNDEYGTGGGGMVAPPQAVPLAPPKKPKALGATGVEGRGLLGGTPLGAGGGAVSAEGPAGMPQGAFQPPLGQPQAPPMTPQPTSSAPMGTAGASTFTGTNNLIGSQFSPESSQRLGQTQGLVDTARQGVGGYQTPTFQGIGTPTGTTGTLDAEALGGLRSAQAPTFTGINDTGPAFTGINAAPGFDPAADTARARSLAGQGLESLNNAPSRQQLAEQTFQSLGNIENAQLGKDIRSAGQRAAAFGRLGSGMVDEETGDIFGAHKSKLADIRRQLSTDAAGQQMGDQLGKINAASGLAGQFGGEDLNRAGFTQGLRGEARGERGDALTYAAGQRREARGERDTAFGAGERAAAFNLDKSRTLAGLGSDQFARGQSLRSEARGERGDALGASQQDFANKRAQLGDLSALEGQQSGQELSNRNELRGERGYQQDLQQQGLENRLGQYDREQAAQQQTFGQQNTTNSLLAQLGFGGDTSGTLGGLSDQYSQNAQGAQAGSGDLLKQLFAGGQGSPAGPAAQNAPKDNLQLMLNSGIPYDQAIAAMKQAGQTTQAG